MNKVKVQQIKSVKTHKAPKVNVYGGMSKLTAAGTGQSAEGNGANKTDPMRKA